MNNMLIGAAVVGQSGGPTAAINATLSGVIRGALSAEHRNIITALYGMKNGIQGLLDDNLIDLSEIFAKEDEIDEYKLSLLEQTPAAALGSCRKKLPDPELNKEFYDSLLDYCKEKNIRYFFYIGGNDSMDTVAKMTKYLETVDYEMRCIGIPKTIDNDLAGTDHTPGFGSAAKYIATTVQEIIRDCAVYTIPAVTIVEIMGRDSGWLAASAALPRIISGNAPDYVYLPEKNFSLEKFLCDVNNALKEKPNVVIAVSEGLKFEDGRYVGEGAQSGVMDVFGHKYLSGTAKALEMFVKEKIGCKVRSVELNICQRCAAHITSKTDISESIETGIFGVESAISYQSGVMVSAIRTNSNYGVSFETRDISKIANAVKCVPDKFINDQGDNVTDECLYYILPLIQGECDIKFSNGIPVHIDL